MRQTGGWITDSNVVAREKLKTSAEKAWGVLVKTREQGIREPLGEMRSHIGPEERKENKR